MPAIPVDALSGQPLLLKQIGANDYSIYVEADGRRLSAGRIMAVQRPDLRQAWLWTITGPAVPDSRLPIDGEAVSLEDAKAAFRAAFDLLLYWASMARDGELPWLTGYCQK
jgi:hypothetical protein